MKKSGDDPAARWPVALRQFIKYGFSGGAAVGLHFVVLTVAVELVNANPTVATSGGFLLGCALNYSLQHRWVFAVEGNHTTFVRRYVAVTAVTFALNVALFHLLNAVLGYWYVLSQVVATVVVFLVNFEINRRFTFRSESVF